MGMLVATTHDLRLGMEIVPGERVPRDQITNEEVRAATPYVRTPG
jgi:hypothetical protein